jgi:hypothetical protein
MGGMLKSSSPREKGWEREGRERLVQTGEREVSTDSFH